MVDISSTRNDRVKLVRALQTQNKARRREQQIVVEGVRLLSDALDCGFVPAFVLYLSEEIAPGRPAHEVFHRLETMDVDVFSVTPEILHDLSDVETPQGVLAVLPRPDLPVPEAPDLVLVLDALNNPGNLGSALRTSAAAGVDLVLLPEHSVDPYNPKVLRGGMGAHFRLPLRQLNWDQIAARYGHLPAYLAEAGGETRYFDVDWRQPSLLIIGGEAHGPGRRARRVSGTTIAIPMAAATESLNAAVAAGVIVYEARRQRILAS